MSQNIFDNDVFFEGYKNLRMKEDNYNDLVEQPAMESLLPDLTDKAVLDIGCGYGRNCIGFINKGAKSVLGIDISEKMLEIARKENHNEKIRYSRLDMTCMDRIDEKFDLIYSSCAVHYAKDFDRLIGSISALLYDGGIFLFSQEHPIGTAPVEGGVWNTDENGEKISYTFSDYMNGGERKVSWFVDGIIKYHRPFSEIVNTLSDHGFCMMKLLEPMPNEQVLCKAQRLRDEFHRPTCLIIKAKKK